MATKNPFIGPMVITTNLSDGISININSIGFQLGETPNYIEATLTPRYPNSEISGDIMSLMQNRLTNWTEFTIDGNKYYYVLSDLSLSARTNEQEKVRFVQPGRGYLFDMYRIEKEYMSYSFWDPFTGRWYSSGFFWRATPFQVSYVAAPALGSEQTGQPLTPWHAITDIVNTFRYQCAKDGIGIDVNLTFSSGAKDYLLLCQMPVQLKIENQPLIQAINQVLDSCGSGFSIYETEEDAASGSGGFNNFIVSKIINLHISCKSEGANYDLYYGRKGQNIVDEYEIAGSDLYVVKNNIQIPSKVPNKIRYKGANRKKIAFRAPLYPAWAWWNDYQLVVNNGVLPIDTADAISRYNAECTTGVDISTNLTYNPHQKQEQMMRAFNSYMGDLKDSESLFYGNMTINPQIAEATLFNKSGYKYPRIGTKYIVLDPGSWGTYDTTVLRELGGIGTLTGYTGIMSPTVMSIILDAYDLFLNGRLCNLDENLVSGSTIKTVYGVPNDSEEMEGDVTCFAEFYGPYDLTPDDVKIPTRSVVEKTDFLYHVRDPDYINGDSKSWTVGYGWKTVKPSKIDNDSGFVYFDRKDTIGYVTFDGKNILTYPSFYCDYSQAESSKDWTQPVTTILAPMPLPIVQPGRITIAYYPMRKYGVGYQKSWDILEKNVNDNEIMFGGILDASDISNNPDIFNIDPNSTSDTLEAIRLVEDVHGSEPYYGKDYVNTGFLHTSDSRGMDYYDYKTTDGTVKVKSYHYRFPDHTLQLQTSAMQSLVSQMKEGIFGNVVCVYNASIGSQISLGSVSSVHVMGNAYAIPMPITECVINVQEGTMDMRFDMSQTGTSNVYKDIRPITEMANTNIRQQQSVFYRDTKYYRRNDNNRIVIFIDVGTANLVEFSVSSSELVTEDSVIRSVSSGGTLSGAIGRTGSGQYNRVQGGMTAGFTTSTAPASAVFVGTSNRR